MEAKEGAVNVHHEFKKSCKVVDSEEDYDSVNVDEAGAPSSSVIALRSGYNQTYIIRSSTNNLHEVLFRCGNWCYSGKVDLGFEHIELAQVPVVIPALQKQQSSLQYLCEWKSMPSTSFYSVPLETLYDAFDFIGEELASERIERKIMRAAKDHAWIEEENVPLGVRNFFELQSGGYECFDDIDLIASKTLVRGLLMLVIYFQRSFYIVLEESQEEQPLLDVRFPDLSAHLQGVNLQTYREDDCSNMKKLTLWQAQKVTRQSSPIKPIQLSCKDVSGKGYTQTFLIRKAPQRSSHSKTSSNLREVLFRFGSWCYNGHIDLGPRLELADIPVIIPMLRRQQSALTFMCEASKMPATSLFAMPMEYLAKTVPIMQAELSKSEHFIQSSGQSDEALKWLHNDDIECFFELIISKCDALQDVEAVASKIYTGDIIMVMIYFDSVFYIYFEENEEEQALLDTHFPDISFQKDGIQLQVYSDGVSGCKELRRLTLWRVILDASDSEESDEEPLSCHSRSVRIHPKHEESKTSSRSEGKVIEDRGEEDTKVSQAKDGSDMDAKKSSFRPRSISRPHHIGPLKDSLAFQSSSKLATDSTKMVAPWDDTGRPLRTKTGF